MCHGYRISKLLEMRNESQNYECQMKTMSPLILPEFFT